MDISSISLMVCDLINSAISLFGETFLVAYFLQITNENISQVSIYYIIVYALLGIGNYLLGNKIKSKPQKRVEIYRIGIIVKSIYILLIVLFKENINQNYILFAILYGISEALYWSTYDIMNIEIIDNNNRKRYVTTKRILGKIVHIIVPIVLGTSIELTSFTNIAIYVFILTIIQVIISTFINTNKFKKEGAKEKYNLAFLYGMMMDTIKVLVVIITIMTFKTSLNLGILTTIFSICSMISLYLYNKLYQKKYSKNLLSICSILIIVGVLGLILDINKTTLILYNFTYSITIYILEVMFKIKSDDSVKEYNLEKWVVEYHTFIEGFMEIGRITGFILMAIVGLLNNIIYFKLLLLIVTMSIPIYSITMNKIEKG